MPTLTFSLSNGFSPLVKQGDTVKKGQSLATKEIVQEKIINIAEELGVPVQKARTLVKKKPGDIVTPGDILAIKSNFLGMDKSEVISNVQGAVIRYERDSGNLVIKLQAEDGNSYQSLTENIISPVDGMVDLCNNEKIAVTTQANALIANKGSGDKGEGELYELREPEDGKGIQAYQIDDKVIDKVITGKRFEREILLKAIAIGVKGIIATNIEDEDITYLTEKNIITPVIEIPDGEYDTLMKWKAKRIYLEGKAKAVLLTDL